ncbi:hypothetical protein PIB30_017608 [Stylosanthes scabra]|uniref:GRF-type domain-containing protein n=1 Tax=Stylosanthes scabra TaxID=79078 RepID=A0ABU6V998_9FABA|nr:hypothetical protein [Stylosanthes scabra]
MSFDTHIASNINLRGLLCNAIAGAAAGVIAATYVRPLDVIKTRLQADANEAELGGGFVGMVSQSSWGSRSSRSSGSAQNGWRVCGCGLPPVLKVSGTKGNHGRRFWGCPHYGVGEHCGYFRWVDKVQVDDDVEKAKLRKKVLLLKTEVRICRWRLKVVAVVGLIGWLWLFWMWLHLGGGRTHRQWLQW